VNITFPGLMNQEVNRFQKSMIVLLNDFKIPLMIEFELNKTKHIDSEILTKCINVIYLYVHVCNYLKLKLVD
jgi:hypothetical protein